MWALSLNDLLKLIKAFLLAEEDPQPLSLEYVLSLILNARAESRLIINQSLHALLVSVWPMILMVFSVAGKPSSADCGPGLLLICRPSQIPTGLVFI